ncbi:hypothetical protein GCM10010911_20840 [Paenibacillus nasutitermitis]|uniref:Rhamnogalacturonase A/B/Epimerase-like pectate lyase domain-containing protein n=1 Tax=Paenibacillus nasutitermitis TaxID=1652958 RepID=A0A917DRG2_9BACL|nr:hypothetical protein GCM10010911_20840 [Paenibacillus nasutitermitis]
MTLSVLPNIALAYRTDNSNYNVKLYSATGNGATDDRTAIQNAINASQPSGGQIYFPKGTYRFASAITFPSNTVLVFEKGAVLVPDSGITITVNGSVDAGLYQIFTSLSGKGDVKGKMQAVNIYPQWWGADGTDSSDDTTAIKKAIASQTGGGTIYFPTGTYIVSSALNVSGLDRLNLIGAGVDLTVIKSTSATADVFYTAPGQSQRWQRFKDFTVDSAVAKTAGAHFNFLGNQYRTTIDNVKLQNWHKGIVFASYEMCWITKPNITSPSVGADAAIQAGIQATAAQGANLYITEGFLRGTDGTDGVSPTSTALGNYGVKIYDADAVMMSNMDIGGFIKNDLLIDPNARASNHYFDSVWFDATRDDAPVRIQGTGIKTEITFANSWIASAGKLDGGNPLASNLVISGSGGYRAVEFTGNRIFNSSGIGIKIDASSGFPGLFTGNIIQNNGTAGISGENYGMKIATPLNTPSVSVFNSTFLENNGDDIYITADARNYSIQNVSLTGSITNLGVAKRISGVVSDISNVIASNTNLNIPPFGEFYSITGTTTIGGIAATWPGHTITLKFNNALTVVDDSQNLRLAGNLTTSANTTLTLICDGAEWIEVSRSSN